MLAKAGFIIAVLFFGALMFAAGTMAPTSIRTPVKSLTQSAVDALPASLKPDIAEPSSKETPPPPAPVPYTSLLPPESPPDGAQYALEVIKDVNAATLEQHASLLEQKGYTVSRIRVTLGNSTIWTVIAAGQYDSEKAAKHARGNLRRDANISTQQSSLDVIILPPPPDNAPS